MRYKNGKIKRTPTQELELFKDKYSKSIQEEPGGCKSWKGYKVKMGAWFNGKGSSVHRMIGHAFMGLPLDAGHSLYVCHKCDVPWCVNLEHLFIGTPADNQLDSVRKGRRNYKGPASPYKGLISVDKQQASNK